jgi:hypothetical protein
MSYSIDGGYKLAVLSAIMARFSLTSAARRDFNDICNDQLRDAPLDGANRIRVPDEIWAYWSAVATGKSKEYSSNGERTH